MIEMLAQLDPREVDWSEYERWMDGQLEDDHEDQN